MTKRKPTADERDRAIVAEAGPWARSNVNLGCVCPRSGLSSTEFYTANEAAARILNRIAREERARARKGER